MTILPPPQRQLWPALRPASGLGYVLYGGTAIALRLGHRQSIDFDFFTERVLDRTELHATFPFLRSALVVQDQPNALTVLVPGSADEHLKVSWILPSLPMPLTAVGEAGSRPKNCWRRHTPWFSHMR